MSYTIFYRGIDNGKQYSDENFNNCPECGTEFQWNRYKDLYVAGNNEETSIRINMNYCTKCNELYIRNDF